LHGVDDGNKLPISFKGEIVSRSMFQFFKKKNKKKMVRGDDVRGGRKKTINDEKKMSLFCNLARNMGVWETRHIIVTHLELCRLFFRMVKKRHRRVVFFVPLYSNRLFYIHLRNGQLYGAIFHRFLAEDRDFAVVQVLVKLFTPGADDIALVARAYPFSARILTPPQFSEIACAICDTVVSSGVLAAHCLDPALLTESVSVFVFVRATFDMVLSEHAVLAKHLIAFRAVALFVFGDRFIATDAFPIFDRIVFKAVVFIALVVGHLLGFLCRHHFFRLRDDRRRQAQRK
jgi:hypothetical protein